MASEAPGRVILGPWASPRVLSLGCSPSAAAAALAAIKELMPELDSAALGLCRRERISWDDAVIVLGVGNDGPLPHGSTIVMHRRWYEAHWKRQRHQVHPCPPGGVVVVVVDGRGGRGVVCAYAPPRVPRSPRHRRHRAPGGAA